MQLIPFKFLLLSSIILSSSVVCAQNQLKPADLRPRQLKPALLYWDYGAPEYLTIETIYPFQDSTHIYWNVSHRSAMLDDSTGNGFDFYQVEGDSIRPSLSHMYHSGFTNYKIEFGKDSAYLSIKTPADTVAYALQLPKPIFPEGPGTPILLGSLPLKKKFQVDYYELNRWRGKAPQTGTIELNTLKVVGQDVVEIDGKSLKTYKLEISSKSGRFTEVWVLKKAPHYWVKVNHKIDDKNFMRSKVAKILMLR